MSMENASLDQYIISGGEQGRNRLGVIARVLESSTQVLLDQLEPLQDCIVVDVGCGGGDVTFELARRTGAGGSVIGIDLDVTKLALAQEEAARRNISNVTFQTMDALSEWPFKNLDMVNIRFVLTHIPNPQDLLARAFVALRPGGSIVVQDIDYDGQFCDPPSPAVQCYRDLYVQTAQSKDCDPFIGRSLSRLLRNAGFIDVESSLAQPYGRQDDIKQIASLTLEAIKDSALSAGIVTAEQFATLTSDLAIFLAWGDSIISTPRIFQAWGYKVCE